MERREKGGEKRSQKREQEPQRKRERKERRQSGGVQWEEERGRLWTRGTGLKQRNKLVTIRREDRRAE